MGYSFFDRQTKCIISVQGSYQNVPTRSTVAGSKLKLIYDRAIADKIR